METVKEYVASLPDDRRKAVAKVRATIRKNLPKGFVETYNWGMISYEIPANKSPLNDGKPLMYAALASQKNHMAVYLSSVFAADDIRDWFVEEYTATGKKLDMGKSCVRFKKLDDLPVELIGEVIARTSVEDFINIHPSVNKS